MLNKDIKDFNYQALSTWGKEENDEEFVCNI